MQPIRTMFRSSAAFTCFVATDVVITAAGILYTIQSVADHRAATEVVAGVALSLIGVGLGAVSIRGHLRRTDRPHLPTNG